MFNAINERQCSERVLAALLEQVKFVRKRFNLDIICWDKNYKNALIVTKYFWVKSFSHICLKGSLQFL